MGYPDICNKCVKQKVNVDLFQGNIKLIAKPFKGNKPKVMLVGLNPTLGKGDASCVLELNNKRSSIFKFIVDKILKPVGLKLEDTYATNLVKCTFPNNQEARDICKDAKTNIKITVKDFYSPFFHNCREHFEAEVREIKPKIIISFGEIPHQLIVEAFSLDVEKAMKKAFSKIYRVNLLGHEAYYAPCIREAAKGHKVLSELLPVFIKNLKKEVKSALDSCV
jgi:uracil-DNA glycosylase family 4